MAELGFRQWPLLVIIVLGAEMSWSQSLWATLPVLLSLRPWKLSSVLCAPRQQEAA